MNTVRYQILLYQIVEHEKVTCCDETLKLSELNIEGLETLERAINYMDDYYPEWMLEAKEALNIIEDHKILKSIYSDVLGGGE